ncbi:FAD-dependent monooxygenase [Micromonospora sp. WMMD882]|uniref:FAD-dependent oxidoreductase n=1 Tax=Micromonospora sp. WMMD882 TaxID=3015151 RepID=UPI00248CFD9E|nr:FAD-dependent oxidoreductase [Micromonospora sp. WMMD882]WBB78810.1 FAD-dependent monooxygenase [Micromonospora sp. WMMD882]
MGDASAVVIGAGIGGLCAAIGLRRRGWDVLVLEQAPRFGEVGAGLTLMANGLRGLDALGVGDAVRDAGHVDAPGGLRTASGRWLSRVDGAAMSRALGTAALGIHRVTLHRLLRAALPADRIVTGAEVVDVTSGPPPRVTYRHDGRHASVVPDLVVAADGIDSVVRARLWPDAPPPAYAGSTAWRGVTDQPWRGDLATAVSWGRGAEFGMVPLGDGRVYWFAAVNAEAGRASPTGDEARLVRALFGTWHHPVPALLDATRAEAVIRTDIHHLGTPLPSYRVGAVALLGDAAHAMTPNLGQGANQAIEDAVVLAAACAPTADVVAALVAYDAQRRPRSQAVARAAFQVGRFGQQLRDPVAVGLRNAVLRLTPPRVALRSMARYADWDPPVVPSAQPD